MDPDHFVVLHGEDAVACMGYPQEAEEQPMIMVLRQDDSYAFWHPTGLLDAETLAELLRQASRWQVDGDAQLNKEARLLREISSQLESRKIEYIVRDGLLFDKFRALFEGGKAVVIVDRDVVDLTCAEKFG